MDEVAVLLALSTLMLNKVTAALLCAVVAAWLYQRATCGHCRCTRRLDGLTAIVTGANSGIGKETARDLARRGARVILACRSLERACSARDDIIQSSGNSSVVAQQVDLGSLASVRQFARRIRATEPRLHILVNNAGVAGLNRKMTADGLEVTMQVNHFGPFLLTVLLLDLLKRSAPSRIIMVSSLLHKGGRLDLDDLNYEKRPHSYLQLYKDSKLCNVLVANELARRLAGTGVMTNSLHPGAVWTDVFRRLPRWQHRILRALAMVFFKDALQGAQTSIHLAVSPDLEAVTGRYFSDCKMADAAPDALDEDLARRLWDASVSCVGLQAHEAP